MKKRKRLLLKIGILIIVILITLAILLAVIKIIQITTTQEEEKEDNSVTEIISNSLIDMNNIDNVYIKEDQKINDSEKAHQTKKYGHLTFENLQLYTEGKNVNFNITIRNDGEDTITDKYYKIICIDEAGEEIGNFMIYIEELKPSNLMTAAASSLEDYSNLYDFVIESYER